MRGIHSYVFYTYSSANSYTGIDPSQPVFDYHEPMEIGLSFVATEFMNFYSGHVIWYVKIQRWHGIFCLLKCRIWNFPMLTDMGKCEGNLLESFGYSNPPPQGIVSCRCAVSQYSLPVLLHTCRSSNTKKSRQSWVKMMLEAKPRRQLLDAATWGEEEIFKEVNSLCPSFRKDSQGRQKQPLSF